jgi:hypothetical protein
MFLMLGAEMGLEEKVGVNLITNSLAEADWEVGGNEQLAESRNL